MNGLIRFALRQGVLLNVVFVGLVVISALLAVPNVPIDRYPNIQFGEVQITTRYPGASPEEVERLVTDVVEESLRGMEQIDFIRSTSIANQSFILVKFEDDSDYDSLYDDLRLRILSVQNLLPTVNGEPLTPFFDKIDVDAWLPVIQVHLVAADPANPIPTRALVLLAKDLRTRLGQIEGVKEIALLGDDPEQFVVALDAAKLEQHRVTVSEVVAAMRSSGTSPPAGIVDTALGERLVRVDSRFRDREDLLSVVVRRDGNGYLLRAGDLADPGETGFERIDGAAINTVNGLDTVACKVVKSERASALDVRADVQRVVDEFLANHEGEGIDAILTLDSTTKIRDGLGVMIANLVLSVVLVMVLLFLFLAQRGRGLTLVGLALGIVSGIVVAAVQVPSVQAIAIGVLTLFVFATCRAAVLTVSGIVFSFLGALLVFWLAGTSVNEISLLGFVLVIGIVVDDAIVVIENIQRRRENGGLIDAVVHGAGEVAWPVFSATLTTMAAFLPLLVMTGSTGDFFSLVPIAVTTALAISLVECLVFLPLHVVDLERILGPDRTHEVIREASGGNPLARPGMLGILARFYDRTLRFNLAHPALVLGASALLFAVAAVLLTVSLLGIYPFLKIVFFPEDTSLVQIYVRTPSDTTPT